jgi:hypothetical protein
VCPRGANTNSRPNFHFINNIFSSYTLHDPDVRDSFLKNPASFGVFNYNWVGGNYECKRAWGVPAWFGSNNINAEGQKMWDDTTLPDFSLPLTNTFRNAGIDLSKPFIINGKKHDALPGMKPGYFSGTKPDLGAVQYGVQTPLPAFLHKLRKWITSLIP